MVNVHFSTATAARYDRRQRGFAPVTRRLQRGQTRRLRRDARGASIVEDVRSRIIADADLAVLPSGACREIGRRSTDRRSARRMLSTHYRAARRRARRRLRVLDLLARQAADWTSASRPKRGRARQRSGRARQSPQGRFPRHRQPRAAHAARRHAALGPDPRKPHALIAETRQSTRVHSAKRSRCSNN
jgi:hypothetical protein